MNRMARLVAHAPVPARALDALDVTRARRNGRPRKLKDFVVTAGKDGSFPGIHWFVLAPDGTIYKSQGAFYATATETAEQRAIKAGKRAVQNGTYRLVRANEGRTARKNGCGCGPGCGCSPCTEKWGPPTPNPRGESYFVQRVRREDGYVAWTGPISSLARTKREMLAWEDAGWDARLFHDIPSVRALVREWRARVKASQTADASLWAHRDAEAKKGTRRNGSDLVSELRKVARGAIQYNDEVRRIMPHTYAALRQLVRRPATADQHGDTAYLRGGAGSLLVKFRRHGNRWLVETMAASPNPGFESDPRKGVSWLPVLISSVGTAINPEDLKNPRRNGTAAGAAAPLSRRDINALAQWGAGGGPVNQVATHWIAGRSVDPGIVERAANILDAFDDREASSLARKLRATLHEKNPGARRNPEYVLWGTPRGETDALHAKVLYTQGKTMDDVRRVQALAARDGWHSFRVQTLDVSKPFDASKAFAGAVRKNHHLRAGDRVRFKGAAGQSLGTGTVVREVDPARDLYAVQWENGSRHSSVSGALLVKVKANPFGPARGKYKRRDVLTEGGQYAGYIYLNMRAEPGEQVRGRGLQSQDRAYGSIEEAEREILAEYKRLLHNLRSNPKKTLYYVILVDTAGREHMIGPMPELAAKDRLRREEGKGTIPDGMGGVHVLKYGAGRLLSEQAAMTIALARQMQR